MKLSESAPDVLDMLVDPGTLSMGSSPAVQDDPLRWTSPRPYADRLKEARRKTGLSCGIAWGKARLYGQSAMLLANDLRFMMGSLGMAEAAAIWQCFQTAISERLPVIWVARGSGARAQEGTYSLAAVAKVLAARNALAKDGVPLITVAADPLLAGCAICGMQGDMVIALQGASIGFAGVKIVQMFTRDPLPPDFQTATHALATGQVDAVVPVDELRSKLASLLGILASPQPINVALNAVRATNPSSDLDAWQLVQKARSDDRPATREIIAETCDAFFELRGDRVDSDDPAILVGLARIAGRAAVIIAHDAARTPEEKIQRNFAMPHPAGHRKALRIVRMAARLHLPIITFVDTPGANPDVRSESEGQAGIMGQLLCELLAAKVPTVSVILGQGSSGGAMVLATTDHVLMTDSSYYAVMSPEGAAAIAWKDPAMISEAAAALHLRPSDMLDGGLIDAVVPFDGSASTLGQTLRSAIAAGLATSTASGKRTRLPA